MRPSRPPIALLLSLLRFLNVLEPGRPILSITKIAMWVCVVNIARALWTGRPIDIPSVAAFFGTASLYAWRRYVLWKTGSPPSEGYSDPTPLPPQGPLGPAE